MQRLVLDEATAKRLAADHGTPLYVLDEGVLRRNAVAYRQAWESARSGSELHFATKANATPAALAILHSEGYGIDAASEGELRAALLASVPPSEIALHGNNKSDAEIELALELGVKRIVIDSIPEIERVADRWRAGPTEIMLRVAASDMGDTHAYTLTGARSKFGIALDQIEKAVNLALSKGLPLTGLHCHVGSQLIDPTAHYAAAERLGQLARDLQGFECRLLNLGGGLGVAYRDEQPPDLHDFCNRLAEAVGPTDATLIQEPGRAVIAGAGVTIYKVGTIKQVGGRRLAAVNGGLADNPRPALYGARYTALSIGPQNELQPADIVSRHCESDPLVPDAQLPASLKHGDLIQVLCTGAYCSSMASRYNRYPVPPTILLRNDGRAQIVTKMEGWEEMFACEVVPEDLLV